jgi:hypothetical protein
MLDTAYDVIQNLGEGMYLVNVKLDDQLLDTTHFLPSANSAGLGSIDEYVLAQSPSLPCSTQHLQPRQPMLCVLYHGWRSNGYSKV